MVWQEFVGPTYPSRSLNISAQRTINLYPERVETPSGKGQYAYHGTPGFSVFADLSSYTWGNKLFAVRSSSGPGSDRLFCLAGTDFLEISSAGVVTDRGNILSGLTIGQCTSNGTDLFLTNDGANGYRFTLATNTLSAAVAGVTPSAGLAFLDGYIIAGKSGTGEFYRSGLYDASSWDALDFNTAESQPDNLVGILVDHGEIWAQGLETIEVWRNTGLDADDPFERQTVIEYGVVPDSFVQCDNTLFFVGKDSRGGVAVYRIEGYNPVRISNHAIEEMIASVGALSSCRAFSYSDRGHSFYVLAQIVPASGSNFATSLVYDVSTQLWHERAIWRASSSDTIDTAYDELPITSYVHCFGKHLVTVKSAASSHKKIFEMNLDTYTDALADSGINADLAIQRERRSPHLVNEGKRVFFSGLQLDAESGPTFSLKQSSDGGSTFGSAITANTRNRFNRLGSSRNRVMKITTAYIGKVAISNAYLRAEAGEH